MTREELEKSIKCCNPYNENCGDCLFNDLPLGKCFESLAKSSFNMLLEDREKLQKQVKSYQDKIEQGTLKEIPENAVVMVKEEYEKLLDVRADVILKDIDKVFKEEFEDTKRSVERKIKPIYKAIETRTRKETAEKFARLVEFHSVSTRDNDGREIFTISSLGLKEILHEEFGIPYDEIAKEIVGG